MMAKNRRKLIAVIAVISVIAILITLAFVSGKAYDMRLAVSKGGTVCDGTLANIDESEHITDVPNGEIRFLINKNIVFKNYYSQGNVMIENPSQCEFDLIITFYNADGKEIYVSPSIAPGQNIANDKLSTYVESGKYNCTYAAKAYKGGRYVGETSGTVGITVE